VSLIVAGPKRTYLLMLFCERFGAGCRTCPAVFERSTTAVDAGLASTCSVACAVATTVRLSRAVGSRVFGVRFTVVHAAA
jgi:hypothetical protein